MSLKRIYNIIFFALICCVELFADAKKADAYYAQARSSLVPTEQINLARKAIAEDETFTEAYWYLAARLKEQGSETEQIATLEIAVKKTTYKLNETRYRLAYAYYENGDYDKSLDVLNTIDSNYPTLKKEALHRRDTIAIRLKSHPVPYEPINMSDINTPYDDYWPNTSLDGKVFSTTVLIADKTKSSLEWNEEIYWAFQDSLGNWKASESIGFPTNTEDNEGSQCFSIDGKYMFFVACDKPDSRGGCDIYYCVHDGTGWSLPINPGEPLNSRYWETNPCLSANGKELFFSSNRPGGKGKKDIWECVVTKQDDGTLRFSQPINLSASINTEEDEFSPFIHADGKTLYFSSNGHPGLGGYDIFFAVRDEHYNWNTPINIGYPINSNKDEFGFIVNSKGDKAYFASDILTGKDKDIYEISLYEEARPTPMNYFTGLVRERTTHLPIATTIDIADLESGKKYSYNSDGYGDFATYLPVNKEYSINIEEKGYLFYSNNIKPSELFNHKAIIDLDSIRVGKALVLQNISFETDSYKLLPKSESELQQIFNFLQKQPNVKIQLIGHTDNVGSNEHNMTLSRNRAREVFNWLTSKGIDAKRIECIGKGATEPIATNDTEEGRALNRRTELKIVSITQVNFDPEDNYEVE